MRDTRARIPGALWVLCAAALSAAGCGSAPLRDCACAPAPSAAAPCDPLSPGVLAQAYGEPRAPACAPARPSEVSPTVSADLREQEMLSLVNRVRSTHDLRPLAPDEQLWKAAKDHSWEQARYGYMGHDSPDPARRTLIQRTRLAGFEGSAVGEVVAWGYTSQQAVLEGWMNSPGHRRILLDPELTLAGFGQVGEYWTGNLGAPRRGLPLAQAPDYARTQGSARTPAARTPDVPALPAPARAAPAPQPRVAPVAPSEIQRPPAAAPPVPAAPVRRPAGAVPVNPQPAPTRVAPALPIQLPG